MPTTPWGSLGLGQRDPLGPGRHYFFFNNALVGILILIIHKCHELQQHHTSKKRKLIDVERPGMNLRSNDKVKVKKERMHMYGLEESYVYMYQAMGHVEGGTAKGDNLS